VKIFEDIRLKDTGWILEDPRIIPGVLEEIFEI